MPVAEAPRRLQHDALFYADEFDLLTTVVPFVREGIAAGDVVLINTGTNPATPLLRTLFADHDQVVLADLPAYETPAVTLETYRRVVQRGLADGARGYHAVGFIDFATSPLPWQEWLRYEAAVNRVFAGLPLRTICPYDVARLPRALTDAMRRAHPGVVESGGRQHNPGYVDPGELLRDQEMGTPPHPLQATAPRMVLDAPDDLTQLRLEVYTATASTDLPSRRLTDLVTAIGEVVANAHRHGGRPVRLRLWVSAAAVVCTVTDTGPGIDDPLRGYARPSRPDQGTGLWAARQLVDVLDFGHGPEGFTVRLASSLRPAPGQQVAGWAS